MNRTAKPKATPLHLAGHTVTALYAVQLRPGVIEFASLVSRTAQIIGR